MKRSYMTLYVSLIVMFIILAGGLYHTQIMDGQAYQAQAKDNRERIITKKATRGIIYDRIGLRLVANNPSYSVAVTPANVPDIGCATQELEGSRVFNELAAILHTNDVIAVKPVDLPLDKVGEVANRLSVLLQTPADNLRGPLGDVMKNNPQSKFLFPIRSDVSQDVGKAVRAQLKNLPGVKIYNELEFNFITRFGDCLKPVTVKRGVDYTTMLSVEMDEAKLPGVIVVPEPVRQYSDGPLFSHLLGYVGPISRDDYEKAKDAYEPDDKVGQTGIEASLDGQLRGTKGAAHVMVNSKEHIVTEIASQQPITGNNVTLTIDSNLQRAVTSALQDGINKANVKSGVAIVMNVNNGQVLSMVSLPSYDNNLFSSGISQSAFDWLNTDPTLPMFNRAVGGAYPPGSTYKMITASAALQEHVVTPDTTEYCPGYITVPYTWNEKQRTTFRDWRQAGQGNINIVQALTVSSDVFFYLMAGPHQEDRRLHLDDGTDEITYTRYYTPGAPKPTEFNGLGIAKLHDYAAAFGLGKKTGIELPAEVPGLNPDPAWKIKTYSDNPWSLGDTLVTAIGQGYNLLTPLQLVNITSAVANGGTVYKPQLVLKVTDSTGKTVQNYQPKALGQVPVLPENLAIVRQGMRNVVADKVKGTAGNHITISSIQIAGKTGTAEFGEPIRQKDGRDVRAAHAWFTAFAPYDKPEIAVVVLLEGGQESLEGSTYAVPVTDAILKAYFHVNK